MPDYQSFANALVELDPATGEALLKTTPAAPAAGASTEAKQDANIANTDYIPKNNAVFVASVHTVPTPGTALSVGPQACGNGKTTTVRALASNTGDVFIGNSASAAQNSATAFRLAPGEALELMVTNWSVIFVDVAVANEGVNVVVEA